MVHAVNLTLQLPILNSKIELTNKTINAMEFKIIKKHQTR
jgi:vacuolar-type H+-ATPase subunit D/Vma8